jgi:hypothetical protein
MFSFFVIIPEFILSTQFLRHAKLWSIVVNDDFKYACSQSLWNNPPAHYHPSHNWNAVHVNLLTRTCWLSTCRLKYIVTHHLERMLLNRRNASLMNLKCISSAIIIIQKMTTFLATKDFIWFQRCLFMKFVEIFTCPWLILAKGDGI